MTAKEVKNALYARHFASSAQQPGAWTCVEEWRAIDFVAFSAWRSQGNFMRVGYEVKVSRSDLRGELLNPTKRAANVEWCNEFYLAVPKGLLTDAELAWQEPEWSPEDFRRTPCRFNFGPERPAWNDDPGPCNRGKRETLFVGPLPQGRGYRYRVDAPCDSCGGKGYEERSRVEQESPTLWVPRDVGLVIVDGRGTHVERAAPRRKAVPTLTAREVGQLVRFVSMRPDPRHHPARLEMVA